MALEAGALAASVATAALFSANGRSSGCFRNRSFSWKVLRSTKWQPKVRVRCSSRITGDNNQSSAKQEEQCYDELDDESLQLQLEEAVKAEDYEKAAAIRDELKCRKEDNLAGVLAANARFYRAFEQGDLAGMQRVWCKGDNVHCVHPGASCISGYELVVSSWEMMLGPDLALPLTIDLQDVEARVKGDMGFVTCVEIVKTPGTSWGRQVATNVFEKQDGVWRICMHHASYTK